MFYMGDRPLKGISEFLGVSVNTVKGKLYRTRQQLGSALSERYGSLLKSHKLKGGFLMQFMEQIRYMPSPTMGSSCSGTTIGKILFFLIMAVYVLNGAQVPAAAAENESEKLTFSGRVVDNDGAPVTDAEVRYAVSFLSP